MSEIIQTKYGKICGIKKDGCTCFLGIPLLAGTVAEEANIFTLPVPAVALLIMGLKLGLKPQKKQKGRSVRSGLSSLFSVHVRCHGPPVNDGDG